ncbi:hypothetical protein BC939DRAFT_451991 [Gamsiella multidivaricata]|uniref:uncharacterized protein n=1 Tax=Gamsiella multidivaricata TaxID=101098 RepID=UPI00221FAF43|nr:uncharacterized protein BC939DRAFT_451991 [Gamsiella multidivaricata]KAI7823398.1 hypothetical protein BC939DRAFT_451991 [Gamsiella multidivaricata]
MDHKRTNNNRITRQDDSGTFYRDIAFVPSGTLAMKETAATSTQNSKQEDAVHVREFYKAVLAMPRTVAPTKRKSQRKQRSTSRAQELSRNNIQKPTPMPSQSPDDSVASITEGSTPLAPSISSDPSATTSSSSIPETTPSSSEEIVRRNWQTNHGPARVVAEGHVLCESCQIEVREDDLDRHQRGTAHLMSQESPIKPLDTLILGHSNKGFRMLVNSGWDYEKGLGAQGQGARHPVATRLKHDRLALGAVGASKKVVTHTFEEIEKSRTKLVPKKGAVELGGL